MSIGDSSSEHLPMTISGSMPAEEIRRCFSQRADLTYRKLTELSVIDTDVSRSLFTGSLIRGCVFTKVVFRRSDLDGIRAENTVFTKCDFTTCDIRSSVFSRCIFEECVFKDSFIDGCEFQECEFVRSGFQGAMLSHCRFRESSLDSCNLTPGSFLHNKLYDSSISDMILGDCTLLYLILRNCRLTRVSINAESVGAIFGMTREQLSQSGIVYLGKTEAIPEGSDMLELVSQEYRKRKWYIGQLVLAVNFGLVSTISAFDNYLALVGARFIEFGFVKGDEIEFLADLLQELAYLERLPLLTVLNILEWCSSVESAINSRSSAQSESSEDSLRTLAGRAALLTNSLLDKLERCLPEVETPENERPLCVKATFHQEPAISLAELLNVVSDASTLDISDQSRLIRVERGSYVEIVCTTLFSVLAFQLFLFLLNGSVIQLTELKHRVNVLISKKATKAYRDNALIPVQQVSPTMLVMLSGLANYAKNLLWLKDASLSGLASSNIKSLEEVEEKNGNSSPN